MQLWMTSITIAWTALFAAPLAAQPAQPVDPGDAAYQEGRKLYDLREWDRAIAKFKEAYELRHDAASLFNIAQSFRLEGNCVEALGFYKTYARNFPDAQNRANVDKFIADLEPCARQQARLVKAEPTGPADAATVKPTPTPAPKPEPSDRRGLALGLAAGGGAALVASVVVGALARSTWNAALEHCDLDRACDAQGLALGDQARTRATIATVLGGVGIAAAAAGIVIYVTRPSGHETGVAIAPLAAPDQVGVAALGRF